MDASLFDGNVRYCGAVVQPDPGYRFFNQRLRDDILAVLQARLSVEGPDDGIGELIVVLGQVSTWLPRRRYSRQVAHIMDAVYADAWAMEPYGETCSRMGGALYAVKRKFPGLWELSGQ